MEIDKIIEQMTLEEKALFLTGANSWATAENKKFNIKSKIMSDGPHGIRKTKEENCTQFPSLVSVGSTWNKDLVFKMGRSIAEDCIEHNVDVLLGPGASLKRLPVCGRNFEYVSEDPTLSGNICAAYINGVQSLGVGTCLKHYALNNQETHRLQTSAEVDIRVLHEIYLKGFEIAVKKSNPTSIMCSYNKIHSIWAAENKYLLNDVLKNIWGYKGFVVSDWGAVRDISKSIAAGLDLQMPCNPAIVDQIKKGIENGTVTEDQINKSVKNVLNFVMSQKPKAEKPYNRYQQQRIATEVATEGVVMLKNRNNVLPITKDKYKKIAIVGEYAVSPLCGQGSAEVYPGDEYITTPFDELKKSLGNDVELSYHEFQIKKAELSKKMLWEKARDWVDVAHENDLVIIFVGAMEGEDTEQYDRNSLYYNTLFNYVIDRISTANHNTVVVSQSGGVMIPGDWREYAAAILEMWIAGEGGGKAIADILLGKANPSGKLSETFPKFPRTDVEFPGDGLKVLYNEGFDVGYRYYDKHPDKILYPFGFGLSYTQFELSNFKATVDENNVKINLDIKNLGEFDGAEVIQVYVGKENSVVSRCKKELKTFHKVFLKKGERKNVALEVPICDLAYFNVLLNDWVVEPGEYQFMIATSSRDIKNTQNIKITGNAKYTIDSSAYATRG